MNAELESRIRSLLAEGRKIEAISLYREQTGLGLNQAKEAVEALESGGKLPDSGSQDSSEVEDEIATLLERGKKIAAIKRYRELTGTGLKHAKEAVEDIAQRRGLATRAGCLGVLLALIGFGILVVRS